MKKKVKVIRDQRCVTCGEFIEAGEQCWYDYEDLSGSPDHIRFFFICLDGDECAARSAEDASLLRLDFEEVK